MSSYREKVEKGEISQEQFLKDMRRANAHNNHPIGLRLAQQGLTGHECVTAYYGDLGEPEPVPGFLVGRLSRRTVWQLEEVGEVYEPVPTNYANRPRWLYKHLHRGLIETHEQFIEYASGARVKLADTDLERLGPQPIGTAPYYDSDVKLPPRLMKLFHSMRRRLMD
jgi:hypothetical protein